MSISSLNQNQFTNNLTPQQRQALAQALLNQSGQPIPNTGGPISPLSVLAKGMQGYMAGGLMRQPGQPPVAWQGPQANTQLSLPQGAGLTVPAPQQWVGADMTSSPNYSAINSVTG